ncbi:hypothetical protein TNCV_4681 [Trichonephila clavipes]|nr:hypothetical protein TNCV_4681 [Trichonephila clavipes]
MEKNWQGSTQETLDDGETEELSKPGTGDAASRNTCEGRLGAARKIGGFWNIRVILARPIGMQPLGVGGVDVRDFEVKNRYESSGRDWSARSAPIGGEGVCLK